METKKATRQECEDIERELREQPKIVRESIRLAVNPRSYETSI